jgi:hypothetical protein
LTARPFPTESLIHCEWASKFAKRTFRPLGNEGVCVRIGENAVQFHFNCGRVFPHGVGRVTITLPVVDGRFPKLDDVEGVVWSPASACDVDILSPSPVDAALAINQLRAMEPNDDGTDSAYVDPIAARIYTRGERARAVQLDDARDALGDVDGRDRYSVCLNCDYLADALDDLPRARIETRDSTSPVAVRSSAGVALIMPMTNEGLSGRGRKKLAVETAGAVLVRSRPNGQTSRVAEPLSI